MYNIRIKNRCNGMQQASPDNPICSPVREGRTPAQQTDTTKGTDCSLWEQRLAHCNIEVSRAVDLWKRSSQWKGDTQYNRCPPSPYLHHEHLLHATFHTIAYCRSIQRNIHMVCIYTEANNVGPQSLMLY